MGAFILPLLSALGSFLPGALGDFFKKQADLQVAQIELQRQIVIEQYKMADQIAKYQAEASIAVLNATGRRFKYFTFVMWFGPFIAGCINASWSKAIFDNLNQMPEWYVQSCMTIMFTIWGIQVATPVISSIFSNLTDYFAAKRTDKIEMKRVSSDEYKKAYFDAIRHYKGTVTPQDVALGDKVLDDLASNRNYAQ